MEIKHQSTGNNDSIEDVFIAIANVRTLDGKVVHRDQAWEAILEAKRAMDFFMKNNQ